MPILTDTERIGTVVAGKYKLEALIGRGGMGSVFRATHQWTGRAVAVKFLHHEFARNPATAKRFLREARAATAIRHANIVDVLDMGEDDVAGVYLVLEFLEGQSLQRSLDTRGMLTLTDTLGIMLPVIDAIAAAHALGITHRDIKPENIFLARSGGAQVPTLLDFGIAKVIDDESSGLRTQTGAIIGTPAYMAPEQIRGEASVGPASDVWALGVVLFECLVGRTPYQGDSPSAVMLKVLQEPAPAIGQFVKDLPEPIERAIARSLSHSLSERYTSARELAAALRQGEESRVSSPSRTIVIGEKPLRDTPLSASRGGTPFASVSDVPGLRTAHPWRSFAVLTAVVTLAIAAWMLWPGDNRPAPAPVPRAPEPVATSPAAPPPARPAPAAPSVPASVPPVQPEAAAKPRVASTRSRSKPPSTSSSLGRPPAPAAADPAVMVIRNVAPEPRPTHVAEPKPEPKPSADDTAGARRDRVGRDAPIIRKDW